MARERRDADAIGNAGVYLSVTCEKLNAVKAVFNANITNLLSNYKGVDADAIGELLSNAVSKIDGLVQNLDYYSKYMIEVARYDNENIERATKKLRKKNTEQLEYLKSEVAKLNGGVIDGFGRFNS